MTFDELIVNFMKTQHEVFIRYIIKTGRVIPETAEDLAMNAYESAIRYKHAYKPGNFNTYMIGIADVMIARYYKHGFNYWSHKDQHVDRVDMPEEIEVTQDIENAIVRKELKDVVNQFVMTIKSKIRKKIVHLFITGMKLGDIAAIMGKSATNIRSQWSLILTQARDWFDKKGHTVDLLDVYI